MEQEFHLNRQVGEGELLSVVVPAYNEEKSLPAFHERLRCVLDKLPMEAEIIYVNDGSTDKTLRVLQRLKNQDRRIGIINLSRNFGKEIASTAGLDHIQGNATILMDADLQHPPEMIPIFLEHWEEGHDVVYARRESRAQESRLKNALVHAFYFLIQKVSRIRIPEDASDYRLLSRRAVESLRQCRERHRFMKGLFAWIGYPQKAVPYIPDARYAGTTKWSYRRLWTFALEGITSFTVAPLKIATYVGLVAAGGAFVHAAIIVYRTLVYGDPVAGFPSLIVVISLLGGIQLITLGIIGEYLGRMFAESKQRPLYIVEDYAPSSARSKSAHQDPLPSSAHGGTVTYENRPGQGPVSKLTFPSESSTPSAMTPLQQNEYLFDRANDSVMTRTIEGRISFWNRAAEELYGWRKEEAIGRVSHDILQTQFPKPLEEIESEFVRNGRWEGKLVHTTRDGGRVVVESRWTLDLTGQSEAVIEINARSTDETTLTAS